MKKLIDLLEEYLEWRRSLRKSPETIYKNKKGILHFIKWIERIYNVLTVDQIRREHLRAWQRYLSTKITGKGHPIQLSTINTYNESLKVMFRYLAKEGYIQHALIDEIHYVKAPQKLPGSVLTHAQMRKMLNKISTNDNTGYRDRAMMELQYSSGIRAGELLGLNIQDIDFKNRTMKVTGKGNKERVVPIGKTAIKHLETYMVAIRPWMKKDQNERAIFINIRGKRMHYRGLLERVHLHAKRAGFENISTHTFRRSCTTELIRGGANMYHVKELLGHESLDTLKHYTKLTIIDLKKTHAKYHPREQEDN